MEAMVLEENPAAQARLAAALAEAGFEVTLAEDVRAAKAALRRGIHDVLILSERVGGRLAHDVALLAELRNPGLGTLLVSDRTGEAAAEIFDLLPSVHAVLGRRTPARTLARLALAAARRAAAEEEGDDAFPAGAEEEAVPPILFRREGAPAVTGGRPGADHAPPPGFAEPSTVAQAGRPAGRRLHLA